MSRAERSRRRAPRGLLARPSARGWVDAAGAGAATLVAVSPFVGTYDGWVWALACLLATVLGLGVAGVVDRRRWPWWAALPLGLVVVALVFPAIGLRGTPARGLPTPGALADMGAVAVDGWRELLTTLPPVDGAGPLVLLPFALALTSACSAMLLARRSSVSHLPLLAPVAVFGLSVLLGVPDAVGPFPRALAGLVVLLAWGAARRRRFVVNAANDTRARVLAGAGVLVVAGAVTALAVPVLAAPDRAVWRDDVTPPTDLTDDPSPLAAFRSLRPGGAVADTPLLRVQGLPDGVPLRLAVVDSYVGTVWAAGDASRADLGTAPGFLRIGARIPQEVRGRPVTATVDVQPGWAEHPQLRVWVPTLGHDTAIGFSGSDAQERSADLRYNPATGAALVPEGLSAGDEYTVSALLPTPSDGVVADPPTTGLEDEPAPLVDEERAAVTSGLVASVADDVDTAADPVATIRALAETLRTTGAYSDGGEGEETILPGHSLGRMATFLGRDQPAGNDEQYASALALAAGHLGLPSRVVLAALPGADGTVTGRDVRAWVEVEVAPDRWLSVPPSQFVPPEDKKPTLEEDRTLDRAQSAIVPPPNAQRPPSSEDGFALDDAVSTRQRQAAQDEGFVLPTWATVALTAAGVPLVAFLVFAACVLGAKLVRRLWRARRGSPSRRVHGAWAEVLDTLRDSGLAVADGHTRSDVAAAASANPVVREVAALVDAADYGADEPTGDDVDRVWSVVDRVRSTESSARVGRRRVVAALDPRSLFPSRRRLPVPRPSTLQHGRTVTAD